MKRLGILVPNGFELGCISKASWLSELEDFVRACIVFLVKGSTVVT